MYVARVIPTSFAVFKRQTVIMITDNSENFQKQTKFQFGFTGDCSLLSTEE